MKEQLTRQEEVLLDNILAGRQDAELYQAEKKYKEIPVPEELKQRIDRTIETARENNAGGARKQKGRPKKGLRIAFGTIGALAAAIVIFMIPLNTSEAFAKQAQAIPVIGTIAKVLTVRSYSYTENDMNVNINTPEIEGSAGGDALSGEGDAQAALIADVNARIAEICEVYERDAKERFEEYKKAFFETGGTEEEWGGRTCDIDVDYTVTYNQDGVLSLILTTTESWAYVYGQQYYYNLDLESGRELTLQDLFGENWVEICNESIVAEIERRVEEEEDVTYWGYSGGDDPVVDDIEGFTTVSKETRFYLNENGNVVICFDKYEIAPGYMGIQEFEIVK